MMVQINSSDKDYIYIADTCRIMYYRPDKVKQFYKKVQGYKLYKYGLIKFKDRVNNEFVVLPINRVLINIKNSDNIEGK
jgi:hypothetical protein